MHVHVHTHKPIYVISIFYFFIIFIFSAKRKRPSRRAVEVPQAPQPEAGGEDPEQGPLIIHEGECEHCFQSPCVTNRNFTWMGLGQEPCIDNSSIRKDKYKNYWKVMSNLGAWNDSRYIRLKTARADGGEWAVCHRREVMPVCILRQLRTLYPNPKDKPYMDHKWE